MQATDEIHEQVQGVDQFEILVDGLNNQTSLQELISIIESVGREIDENREGYRADEMDHITLGWLRIVWEAHHLEGNQATLEPHWRE